VKLWRGPGALPNRADGDLRRRFLALSVGHVCRAQGESTSGAIEVAPGQEGDRREGDHDHKCEPSTGAELGDPRDQEHDRGQRASERVVTLVTVVCAVALMSSSRPLELGSDLLRRRFCRAARGRQSGPLRQVVHSSKFSVALLGDEPEMEVRRVLHDRQEVDALDSCGGLYRRNEPMEKGPELGTFGWRHFTEIQKMSSSLNDDRSCAGRHQRGVLDEELLTFDDVATWKGGGVQAL
jgi:hypothetical protein